MYPSLQLHISTGFLQRIRIALYRFRSPLLTVSRLISFPLPTKMLQSGRLPFPKGMTPQGCQDVQFSHRRIKDSMRLPVAYRSLARPSSAPEPSHPPYGVTVAIYSVLTQLTFMIAFASTVIGSPGGVLQPGPSHIRARWRSSACSIVNARKSCD